MKFKVVDIKTDKVVGKLDIMPRKTEKVLIDNIGYTVIEVLHSIGNEVTLAPIILVEKMK